MTRGFIICVDDEQAVLNQLSGQLRRRFGRTHEIEVAESAEEAQALIAELVEEGLELEMVIADQIMPGLKGDRFLEIINKQYPQAMKVLLTGQAGLESAIYAINHAGLHKYIEKPWTEEDLILSLQGLLHQYKYHRDILTLQAHALKLQFMLDESQVINFLPQALRGLLPARRLLLLLDASVTEEREPQPRVQLNQNWPGLPDGEEPTGLLPVLWPLLRRHQAALLAKRGAGESPELGGFFPEGAASLLAAPLWGGGALLGGILLADPLSGEDFTAEDTEVFTVLASQVASTLKRIRLQKRLQEEILLRATYERYLAKPVVERLLSHPDEGWELGGTEREVTILFADLRGFTSLAERLTPSRTVALLNRWFSAMTPVVFQFEGTLDKYIGDSVMAIFGAPFPQEDHPVRAIFCAVEMQHAIMNLNQELQAEFGHTLTMGIGINSGRVTAGNVGSEQRLEYTVIGDAVNLAARLEATAKAGKIFLSRSVWEQAREALLREKEHLGITWGELATLIVKGKSLEVEAIEVMWEGSVQ